MSEIPSWFWMAIIAGLSVMLGMILFYMGMLLRESMLTVRELREMMIEAKVLLAQAKLMFNKVNGMLQTLEGTVNKIAEVVLSPFQAISGFFKGIKDKLSAFGIGTPEEPDPRDYFDPSEESDFEEPSSSEQDTVQSSMSDELEE